MENPIVDLIHRHASVRRYKPDPLPASLIETVVAAGQRASTSSNLQAYSVIAVIDAAGREQLSLLCANQAFVREAPVFLAWCADLAHLDRACQLRGYTQATAYVESLLMAVVDTSLAAQTAMLAAESLGLGACYVGALRNHPQEAIQLLGLPRLTFPIFGMTLGWPAKEARVRPRLPLRAVLHWEQYQTDQDPALAEYDRTMADTGIYAGRQIAFPGKEGEMKDYGWLEHSARRAARPERPGLSEIIRKQGFGLG
jgi:nitroreductase